MFHELHGQCWLTMELVTHNHTYQKRQTHLAFAFFFLLLVHSFVKCQPCPILSSCIVELTSSALSDTEDRLHTLHA